MEKMKYDINGSTYLFSLLNLNFTSSKHLQSGERGRVKVEGWWLDTNMKLVYFFNEFLP